jgi:hypothetical protein
MADIENIIRVASRRPLTDAAFYISFYLKKENINSDIYDIIKLSHNSSSLQEIEGAICLCRNLEIYLSELHRRFVDGEESLEALLAKARDKYPGLMHETYALFKYLIGAKNIPPDEASRVQMQAQTMTTREWSDIPYFRKPLFLAALFLLFMPGFLLITMTGEIYYKRNGNAFIVDQNTKHGMTIVVAILLISYVFRYIK